jgi:phage baseplate assembly protein W
MTLHDVKQVSLADSVANFMHLMTITKFEECKHDPNFGCAIWDHDFEVITNMQGFKERIRLSMEETIKTYEKRLSNVIVEINIQQFQSVIKKRRVKNRINVTVTGSLVETNEFFRWEEKFFIGPLSYY